MGVSSEINGVTKNSLFISINSQMLIQFSMSASLNNICRQKIIE